MSKFDQYFDRILDTEVDLLQHAADEDVSVEGQLGWFVQAVTDNPNASEHATERLATRRMTVDSLIQRIGTSATLRQMEIGDIMKPDDDIIRGILTHVLLQASRAFVDEPKNEDAVADMLQDQEYRKRLSDGRVDGLHQYIADKVGTALGVYDAQGAE